jgi:hypothetical protein
VLVRTGLDVNIGVEADVGGAEDLLAGVRGEREVMQAAACTRPVLGVDEVVALVPEEYQIAEGIPSSSTICSVQRAPRVSRRNAEVAGNIGGEVVDVVEPAHVGSRPGLRAPGAGIGPPGFSSAPSRSLSSAR